MNSKEINGDLTLPPKNTVIKSIPELDSSIKYHSNEFYIMLFLLINEGARPYYSLKDIEEGTPLYRQQVAKGTNKLKEKRFIDKDKKCPECRKEYKTKIPPICRDCFNKIFPDLIHITNHHIWPNYTVKLNSQNKSRVKKEFKNLDKLLELFTRD